jgi:hypothetical protein
VAEQRYQAVMAVIGDGRDDSGRPQDGISAKLIEQPFTEPGEWVEMAARLHPRSGVADG